MRSIARVLRAVVGSFPAWRNDLLLNALAGSKLLPFPLRAGLLRRFGLEIGKDAVIFHSCYFGGTDISLGDRTFVNYGCTFDNNAAIGLGIARLA